jgi:hypothetical protein
MCHSRAVQQQPGLRREPARKPVNAPRGTTLAQPSRIVDGSFMSVCTRARKYVRAGQGGIQGIAHQVRCACAQE